MQPSKHASGGSLADSTTVSRTSHPTVATISGTTSPRTDGNNVDMESENIDLAVNTLRYEALSAPVGGYFNGLKTAINSR